MKKVNYYNYDIENLTDEEFIQWVKVQNDADNFRNKFIDADAKSVQLYKDLNAVFSLGANNEEKCELVVGGVTLGSDYIGPSRSWARSQGKLSGEEIYYFYKGCRVLAGHMLWPRHKNSINQNRGGDSGYQDRFDMTLWALKKWFESSEEKTKLKESFDKDAEWLKSFENFKKFVSFFNLEDFVDKNNDPWDFTTFHKASGKFEIIKVECDKVPAGHGAFLRFAEGNLYCINQRQKRLFENFTSDRKENK